MEYSADFKYIELALENLWKDFCFIVEEMESFVPRPVANFEGERREMVDHYIKHNQNKSIAQLEAMVDEQIKFRASERFQFSDKFSNRFSALWVSVSLVSHTLCEAVINAILALGLCKIKCEDIFSIIEKVDIKEKWKVGPKNFCPTYCFDCSQAYWETLTHLVKDRNSLVHYKVNLKIGKREVLKGSGTERMSFEEQAKWMYRYFSLPYDLDEVATRQLGMLPILIGSKTISRSSIHGVTPRFTV